MKIFNNNYNKHRIWWARKKEIYYKKYLQSCITGLLLQDCYKVQWILNISKKSPCPVFLINWVTKNLERDSLRTVVHKNQYMKEMSKSWEDSLNMAVAICLFNYKTCNNQRHEIIKQNKGKLWFISCKRDETPKPKSQKLKQGKHVAGIKESWKSWRLFSYPPHSFSWMFTRSGAGHDLNLGG